MPDTGGFPKLDITQFGIALSAFFVISYVLCIASGIVLPDWELHKPWLQFFPGFEWLTVQGFLIGLVESIVYAWYAAVLFGWLFNVFVSQRA